jgi:hypothetical protein
MVWILVRRVSWGGPWGNQFSEMGENLTPEAHVREKDASHLKYLSLPRLLILL